MQQNGDSAKGIERQVQTELSMKQSTMTMICIQRQHPNIKNRYHKTYHIRYKHGKNFKMKDQSIQTRAHGCETQHSEKFVSKEYFQETINRTIYKH